ncbi:MAG: cation:proton antiporter subunit C [Propionivibrio sp.]|nr:cation:proton antiporter subunit C [Propionivibrio sp.]
MIGHFTYFVAVFLMVAGLFIVIARSNPIKKLIGLSIFQTSVYILYIAPGKLIGGTAPILSPNYTIYSNPLPHVLILTAIVVGVATLALGLALAVRIREAYGSIEEDEILERDNAVIANELTNQFASKHGDVSGRQQNGREKHA